MWPDRTRSARAFDGIEYAPGRKFRVVQEGLKLSGLGPYSNGGHVGWKQELHVGDVIECTGFGPGWGSDPGFGVEWTSEAARTARAVHCDIYPSVGGIWAYRPPAGSVEPIKEEER